MKKCPYCAEEIQDEAIKCRYCGSDLIDKTDNVRDAIPEQYQKTFKYKAKTNTGELKEGLILALNQKEAIDKLCNQGLYPEYCDEIPMSEKKESKDEDVPYEHFSMEEDTKEKRIYKEEKVRFEAREMIKKEADAEKTKTGCIGCITLIAIVLLWQLVSGLFNETKKQKAQDSSPVSISKKPIKISEPIITQKTSAQKTSVYEGIGITYDQVMTGLSNSFSMKKSTSVVYEDGEYVGKALNKYADIQIVGNKSNILFATIYLDIPPGRSDIHSENVAFILQFLKNVAPEWKDSETWAVSSVNKFTMETSGLERPKEIVIGNKKISMNLFPGTLSVTVEKANDETAKDGVVLKNGKRIEGKITEETDEFIVVRESIGTEGFVETKYNKLDIEKAEGVRPKDGKFVYDTRVNCPDKKYYMEIIASVVQRNLNVQINTNIPDGSKVDIGVSRIYKYKDEVSKYSGDISECDITIKDGTGNGTFIISDEKWIKEKKKQTKDFPLISYIDKDNVEVLITFTPKGEQLDGVYHELGENFEKLDIGGVTTHDPIDKTRPDWKSFQYSMKVPVQDDGSIEMLLPEVFNAKVVNSKIDKGQTNDYIILKNGKIIKGKITEETDEFIVVRESIGTDGFAEEKYNKSEIDKVERDTDTDPTDTRKYR